MTLKPLLLGVACLLGAFAVGCVSPQTDVWDNRVGFYTYDQAILEYGPPDRSSRLSDGTMVAEWIIRPRGGFTFGLGTGITRGPVGIGVGQAITPQRRDRSLRLVFNDDGLLTSWGSGVRW
jgi:hypothetical protein